MDSTVYLSWADLAMGLLLLASLLVGIFRGFVFEALSLAAWVIAWLATPFVAPLLAPYLPAATYEGGWQSLAAPVLSFLLVLVLVSVAARLLRVLLHATPLKGPDRLLGAGFGLVRGALLCLLAGVLIGLTPLRKHPAWEQSQARPLVGGALLWLAPLLPQDLHRLLESAAVPPKA
jgi:membrane protein required for colicin V production